MAIRGNAYSLLALPDFPEFAQAVSWFPGTQSRVHNKSSVLTGEVLIPAGDEQVIDRHAEMGREGKGRSPDLVLWADRGVLQPTGGPRCSLPRAGEALSQPPLDVDEGPSFWRAMSG